MGGCGIVGDQGLDGPGLGHDRVHGDADLRAVGDDDHAGGPLDRQALDLGLAVVQLGQAPLRAQAGGADDGQVEPEAGQCRGGDRSDTGQFVAADRATQGDDLDRPGPEQAGRRQRCGHHDQPGPDGQEPGELLGRGADPDEHDPGIAQQVGGAHPDPALLTGVLEGAGVERDIERAGEVGRRPAVGLSDEAVPLESPDVSPDGHLGHVELAGEVADVDGLVLGDVFEDPMAPVDGRERTSATASPVRSNSQHPTRVLLETHNKH